MSRDNINPGLVALAFPGLFIRINYLLLLGILDFWVQLA
jgi:hypothetical protein